jgi:hypothetical protein
MDLGARGTPEPGGHTLKASATALAAVVLLSLAGPAAGSSGLRFSTFPRRAVQRDALTVAVAVRTGVRCAAAVRYKGGRRQALGTVASEGGRAVWRWDVPGDAKPGFARVHASCGRAGSASRRVIVVGQVVPPRIDVVKKGFSTRPLSSVGTTVTYGLLLHNASPRRDALDVYVLVNFVGPENRLIGSASTNVPMVAAGSDYALGADASFQGAAPIQRLEVVIRIGRTGPHTVHVPAVSNVFLERSFSDPGWVGAVDGELTNDQSPLILQYASLSAVLLDAGGNIVGGATGFTFATLPPGGRVFFKLQSFGLRAVPIDRVAGVVVSVQPTYVQP